MPDTDKNRLNEAWMDASDALDILKEVNWDDCPGVRGIAERLERVVDEIWAEYSAS
ncbi:MAG: hypothetical protein LDL39_04205 [Magnetospirillum sp.]|nr:hypothetical protein [Magnetospirillum sp.]